MNKYPGVYVVYEEGSTVCKIGSSFDVEKRVKSLQTSNPRKLHLYTVAVCDYSEVRYIETLLHRRFRNYRIRGEWFNIHPYILLRAMRMLERSYDMGLIEMP